MLHILSCLEHHISRKANSQEISYFPQSQIPILILPHCKINQSPDIDPISRHTYHKFLEIVSTSKFMRRYKSVKSEKIQIPIFRTCDRILLGPHHLMMQVYVLDGVDCKLEDDQIEIPKIIQNPRIFMQQFMRCCKSHSQTEDHCHQQLQRLIGVVIFDRVVYEESYQKYPSGDAVNNKRNYLQNGSIEFVGVFCVDVVFGEESADKG